MSKYDSTPIGRLGEKFVPLHASLADGATDETAAGRNFGSRVSARVPLAEIEKGRGKVQQFQKLRKSFSHLDNLHSKQSKVIMT